MSGGPIHRSRSEYAARMHRVLEHIDRHLDEPLALATLADLAHFSPFHFHRLFATWMGETLGDYLRRRRLEVAATRLGTQPRLRVLDVALSVGFGSAEAFARAFRSRFGMSASAWRRGDARRRAERRAEYERAMQESKPDQADRKRDQDPGGANDDDRAFDSNEEPIMEVKIIERPAVRIAYLRHIGPYGGDISAFWGRTVMPWITTHGLGGRPMYGISRDDPSVTAPAQCRYDAGVEVPDAFVATGDAQITTVPGGRYAASRFYGPGARIQEAWDALMRDWLPSSGMQLDARPMFEHYPADMRYDEATGNFECELLIPVVPL